MLITKMIIGELKTLKTNRKSDRVGNKTRPPSPWQQAAAVLASKVSQYHQCSHFTIYCSFTFDFTPSDPHSASEASFL